MSFKFHTFNKKNKFSATNFLSKIKEKNDINLQLNINTIRTVQLTNSIEKNIQIKKDLLKNDLNEELSKIKNDNKDNNLNNFDYNSNFIKKYLTLMLIFNSYLPDETKIDNYQRSVNNIEFSNIISCFQLLMKHLFELKEYNEIDNKLLDNKLSLLKKEADLVNNNDIIINNNNKINKLENKKLKLQLFLKKNGKDTSTKITKFYVCDVCPYPYKKFYSYRELHKHYVNNHINPYLSLNNNFTIINQGFDKLFFDNKMNELADDVIDTFKNVNTKKNIKSEDNFNEKKNKLNFIIKDGTNINIRRRNKRYETVGPTTYRSNYFLRNFNSNSYSKENEIKKEIIRKRIEYIKKKQKDFEINFQNQIKTFLEEFKNEITKLKNTQIEEK